jgi:hypothetical protein
MKLRSLILRVIFAWVPILPPPALVAKPRLQPSPRILHAARSPQQIPFTPGLNRKTARSNTV